MPRTGRRWPHKQGDLRKLASPWVGMGSPSSSEICADIEANIAACAQITRPGAMNVHEIDLRHHYFKYLFEMLCHSEEAWKKWLNPSNNLNRWRLPEY